MKYGPLAEVQGPMFEAQGRELPEDLIPPYIIEGYESWYDAFWELSTDRQIGFVTGPIPSKSIREYADYLGLDRGESVRFRSVIRAMDKEFLDVSTPKPTPKRGVGPTVDTETKMTPSLFKAMFSKGKKDGD